MLHKPSKSFRFPGTHKHVCSLCTLISIQQCSTTIDCTVHCAVQRQVKNNIVCGRHMPSAFPLISWSSITQLRGKHCWTHILNSWNLLGNWLLHFIMTVLVYCSLIPLDLSDKLPYTIVCGSHLPLYPPSLISSIIKHMFDTHLNSKII